MSHTVYIVSACRTAIGNFQGAFNKYEAAELGGVVIEEAVKRANLQPGDIDNVIMGQVLTAGQGQNPARQAAVKGKIPYDVPSFTVNMLCGSGLKAVHLAFQGIKCGDNDIVVAGGQESMTRSHHSMMLRAIKSGNKALKDTMLTDGLYDAFHDIHMGRTAEFLASEYQISRELQDLFAEESQRKAIEAIENGLFKEEIVPFVDERTNVVDHKIIDTDEFPKPGSTFEMLSSLRPAFETKSGTVTAGNSSGINDGAAALVLCNEIQLERRNLKPLAKIIAVADLGMEPMSMGVAPISAVAKVLLKAGWDRKEVDLYEFNEAFAVQSICCIKGVDIPEEKVNINGGAIALGHPIGASGARVLVTLIYNLKREKKTRGVASLCIGGGMGIAIAIEMC